jgi:hypothetical protein
VKTTLGPLCVATTILLLTVGTPTRAAADPAVVHDMHAAEVKPVTAQWRIVELTFTSAKDRANPFADVTVDARFTQGDTTIVRPAFWDGERTWKVRFAPPTLGEWTWTTTCSDPNDAGLHGQAGALTCEPYLGDNPNYCHGFLRVSENRRYFVRADGTPFFWLGDTHWQMADWERLDANNAPDANGRSQFAQLVEDRRAKGFTVYQNYFNGHGRHWWRDDAFTCIDPTRFRTVMDPMLDHLAGEGFVVAQGIGLYITAVKVPKDSLVRLARYVAARYGAHPLVWITAQEVNLPDDKGVPRTNLDAWRAAAEEFARANGYGQPVAAHMFVGTPTVWGQEPWLDWFALQGGHTGTGLRSVKDYRFYWQYTPTRPYLETEAMYEQILCGPRKATAADVRQSAWKALLCGSPGYTYGAAAVWLFKWDKADKRGEAYNPGTWWYEGMRLPGSGQMRHLAAFVSGLEWWRLEPRFGDPAWCDFADRERTVLATDGQAAYVVYSYGPKPNLGSLKGLAVGARYAASWFDPRTGESHAIGDVTSADGAWTIPPKPDAADWVLLLRKAGK